MLMNDVIRNEELVTDKGFHVVRIWATHLKSHREEVRKGIKEVLYEGEIPDNTHLFDWGEFASGSNDTLVTTVEELELGRQVRIEDREGYYKTFEGTVVDGKAGTVVDVTGEQGSGPLPSRTRFLIEKVRMMTVGQRIMAHGVTTHGYTEPMGEIESVELV
jgi:hypothetical protein